MRIRVDGREVEELELDLREAPVRIRFATTRFVEAGARRIDREMVKDATGHTGSWFGRGRYALTGLPKSVSHEMLNAFEAEIGLGPDGGQGSLAHIIAHGSVNNGPAYDYTAGPRRALKFIERDAAREAEESILGRRGPQ